MNSIILYAAALTCTVTFSVHFFVGHKPVVLPLLASPTLPPASKWLNYMCWHITSIMLLLMTPGYLWAAYTGSGIEMIVFFTATTGFCSALSTAVAIKGKIKPWHFPSTTLLAILSVLGCFALLT